MRDSNSHVFLSGIFLHLNSVLRWKQQQKMRKENFLFMGYATTFFHFVVQCKMGLDSELKLCLAYVNDGL